jgi:hypothetical protein
MIKFGRVRSVGVGSGCWKLSAARYSLMLVCYSTKGALVRFAAMLVELSVSDRLVEPIHFESFPRLPDNEGEHM